MGGRRGREKCHTGGKKNAVKRRQGGKGRAKKKCFKIAVGGKGQKIKGKPIKTNQGKTPNLRGMKGRRGESSRGGDGGEEKEATKQETKGGGVVSNNKFSEQDMADPWQKNQNHRKVMVVKEIIGRRQVSEKSGKGGGGQLGKEPIVFFKCEGGRGFK